MPNRTSEGARDIESPVVSGTDPKKSRHALSVTDRKRICQLKQSQPDWSNPKVAEEASKLLNRAVVRNTVCRVLAESDKWLNYPDSEGSRKKERKPKWEDLETQLLAYHQEASSNGGTVGGAQLRDKAKELATVLHVEDFKCSPGWIDNFKRRNHLKRERTQRKTSKAETESNEGNESTQAQEAAPAPASYRTKRRKQNKDGSDQAQRFAGNMTSLLIEASEPQITRQTDGGNREPPPLSNAQEQQAGDMAAGNVAHSESDLLVSQNEALTAAKLLLAFFSERPNIAPEDHQAMRQIASAITKQK